MPAAAAIAVATATAAQTSLPRKADDPAIHQTVSDVSHQPAKPASPAHRP
jgi:hypothetical protein